MSDRDGARSPSELPLLVLTGLAFALAAGLAWRGPHLLGGRRLPELTFDGRAQVEGCLRCHEGVRGLGPSHDPSAIGCSSCHLGDPSALEAADAHRGMEVLAGDLASVERTCGRSACHADETARVQGGLMAGSPGILAVNSFAFGERPSPEVRAEDDMRRLDPRAPAASPAEDHARKLCASCHLGARKTARGDQGFASRGGGCAACHLAEPAASEDERATLGFLHPDLSARVPESRCEGCHSRSGRIALSFRGVVELEPGDPRVVGALPDGRPVGRASEDVHARAGMTCMDCHSERDLMGDGRPHAFSREAVSVTCELCHTEQPERAASPDAAVVAERLRALWVRRGMPPIPTATRPLVDASGTPFWRTDAASRSLWLDASGDERTLPRASERPYHALRGHERLSCQACHTQWAPRCVRCHTTQEPRGEDVDHLSGERTPGRWTEEAGGNGYGLPVLALDPRGRIGPFVEGMHLTIEARGRSLERRLWAPLDPHTSGPSRACDSCHPASEISTVLPERGETTRPRARLLDADERARVATVGRCVSCHERYEDPVFADFGASLRELDRLRARPGDPHRER